MRIFFLFPLPCGGGFGVGRITVYKFCATISLCFAPTPFIPIRKGGGSCEIATRKGGGFIRI
ncbi:hypothetical protein [Helicobacter sp. T3_23-1059]